MPQPSPPAPQSRTAILDVVRARRTVSRVELAEATGLTQATVSTVVRRLLDDGLVVEVGREASTGGKPRTLLQIQRTAGYAVGVQLGTEATTYVLADLGGATVSRLRHTALPADEPERAVQVLSSEVEGVVERAGVERAALLGVGVVGQRPLLGTSGAVVAPDHMRPWGGFPLRQRLEVATGLPVVIDNDATATAAGLYWADGVEPTASLAALFMGEGLGAGVITGGHVLRGSSGSAGEVGHTTVQLDGPPCWCGNRGCAEAVAGPAAVVARARAADLPVGAPERPVMAAFGALARLALGGSQEALALVEESARYVAVAAHTLVNVVDPELLVLTGPAFAVAGPLYLPVVADHLAARRFARGAGELEVRLSTQGPEAAALGAAALALQARLAPRGADTGA